MPSPTPTTSHFVARFTFPHRVFDEAFRNTISRSAVISESCPLALRKLPTQIRPANPRKLPLKCESPGSLPGFRHFFSNNSRA